MTLGRKGDYSIRAMLAVARHYDAGRRKAREIAAEMDIPDTYVTQILANLVKHDLLTAVAGPDGGYHLARRPEEITVLDVVEAAEGQLALEACVLRGGPCDWGDICPIHETWSQAQTTLIDVLSGVTFGDLSAVDRAMEAGTYEPPPDAAFHPEPVDRRGVREQTD